MSGEDVVTRGNILGILIATFDPLLSLMFLVSVLQGHRHKLDHTAEDITSQ